MNWAWANSLDQLWRSPNFPMWLTLAAAGFFALIMLMTLVRAEKSVANGALTVITLLAVAVAVAATIRGFGPLGTVTASPEVAAPPPIRVAVPALSCIDDLAGETVETACEKTLFGSAETTAAAVSYAAARLTRLTGFGDVAAANKNMSPELDALRRSVERDRYGLMAYVLAARDRCKPSECAAYASLTDHNQIASNMEERIYEGLIMRYSASWNAPATAVAALPGLLPQPPPLGATGKPTNAEFPSSASIPPINIMTAEPGGSNSAPPRSQPPATTAQTAVARPTAPPAAPKKPPAPKSRVTTPVQLAPAEPSADKQQTPEQ
jgi:hypothetical protein